MKNNKGITLIALVVTIIILLILAGISIAMLTGENGILTNAKKTSTQNEYYGAEEQFNLAYMAVRTEIMAQTVARGTYVPSQDIAHLASIVRSDLNGTGWSVTYDATSKKIFVKFESSKIDKGVINNTSNPVVPAQESQVTGWILLIDQSTDTKQSCSKEWDKSVVAEGAALTGTAASDTIVATYSN